MTLSVLMIAYNAAPFLREAILSVLHQTYRDFELTIVDDGSTDETRAIAESFAKSDPRVRVFTQPNGGTARALNKGIELAQGEWVFLMHADDLMQPNRLERQVAFLEEHPDLAVASSLVRHIDRNGRVIGKDNSVLITHEAVADQVRRNEPIGFNHPAVVLRKEAVQSVGGYRQEYWPAEDLDLWNRLVEHGHKILVQPEFLLDYRIHGNAASISRAGVTRQKVRWIRDSMQRRRRNEPELTWDEFLAYNRSLPLGKRITEKRQDMARVFYKIAVAHFADKRYLRTIGNLSVAIALRPRLITSEVASKLQLRKKRNPHTA